MCFEGSTVTPPPGPARNRPLTGQHSCRQPAKVIVVNQTANPELLGDSKTGVFQEYFGACIIHKKPMPRSMRFTHDHIERATPNSLMLKVTAVLNSEG